MGRRFLNGVAAASLPAPDTAAALTTVDTTVSTTTAANVTGLEIPVGLAPGTYKLDGVLVATSAAITTGVQVAIVVPAGTTPALVWQNPSSPTATVPTFDRAGSTYSASTAAPFAGGGGWPILLDGVLIVSTTTTTTARVTLRSEVAASAVAVKAGSYLLWRRLNPDVATSGAGTTFAGLADGAAWPAPWTVARTPAGGGAVVTSGWGRLTTGAAGAYNSADAVAIRYGGTALNSTWVAMFRLVTSEPYPSIVLRSDQANLDPGNGVVVGITKTSLNVATVANYVYTTVAAPAKTHTVGADYDIRIVLTGTTLQVRTWAAAAAEPGTWDVNVTVPAGVAGSQGITVGSGNPATSQVVWFDDITVT